MKTKSVTFAALAVSQLITLAAYAQSTSSASVGNSGEGAANGSAAAPGAESAPAATAPTNDTMTGANVANAPKTKGPLAVSYLGIMYGPALSNELNGKTYSITNGEATSAGGVPYVDNRPSLKYSFTDNVDAGVQARFNVRFQGDGLDAVNGLWRLFSNVKNIYKDDVYQFNFLGRAILPTNLRAHNQAMLPSPELLPTLNITPKNSRFNLSVYPQIIKFLYSDSARSASAMDYLICGNFEGTYQLTGSTAITFGYYPEYVTNKDRAMYMDMNEVDLGISFDIAKGWALNPFIAADFLSMGANGGSASKNMAVNMTLSGTLL